MTLFQIYLQLLEFPRMAYQSLIVNFALSLSLSLSLHPLPTLTAEYCRCKNEGPSVENPKFKGSPFKA